MITHILCNPEEQLVELTNEYNQLESQVKDLVNNGPFNTRQVDDFVNYRQQQLSIEKQIDQLFSN